MSHRTPSKTEFDDDWREDASCLATVKEAPELATAWDNVDKGTWEKDNFVPDENAAVAKQLCFACPVRLDCIKDALSDNEAEGIRGGFRFEGGYVDKYEARKLYQEFRLRGKIRKTARRDVKTTEMQEVRTND